MSIEPPQGSKVAPSFSWRFGAEMAYPLTPGMAGTFTLGYESRAVRIRSLSSAEYYSSSRVGYLDILPGFQFGAFWLGMNFGLPLGGSVTRRNGSGSETATRNMTDAEFDRVQVTLEPRIGVVIPVHVDANGWLGITITGGFALNEFIDPGDLTDAQREVAGNYQTVSGLFGLTYQFAIQGTGR